MNKNLYAFAALAFVTASALQAAPLTERVSLPFDADSIKTLKNDHGYSDEEVVEFITTLEKISFHPDHKNPKNPDDDNNKKVGKTYYMSPYFQPSLERDVIGSDTLAKSAIKVAEGIDALVDVFNFELNSLREKRQNVKLKQFEIRDYRKLIKNEEKKSKPNATKIKSWQESIAKVEKDIALLEKEINAILFEGSEQFKKINKERRQELVGSIIYNFSKLGVLPTDAQNERLNSSNSKVVLSTLAELRLLASNGQFAIRSVLFENGLTQEEMNAFSLYRKLRPDVTIKSLPVEKVYVRPLIQTYGESSKKAKGAFMIREINRSSESAERRGLCGSTNVCNVAIEYTESGAQSSIAKVNSIGLPVTFVGDVTVKVPDFHGRFKCRMTTGWWAKGRADVKDGGIIYDGDKYNRIHYNDLNNKDCKVEVLSGARDGAEYAFLNELNSWYSTLFKQRVMKSKAEKDAYREQVVKEVNYHAAQSQKNKFPWFSRVITMTQNGLGGGWSTAVVAIVGVARNFYWHTRIEDTKVTSEININQEIKTENMVETKEFAFDGFPTICFKKAEFGSESEIVGCKGELRDAFDNEIGNFLEACDYLDTQTCSEKIEMYSVENEDGLLVL